MLFSNNSKEREIEINRYSNFEFEIQIFKVSFDFLLLVDEAESCYGLLSHNPDRRSISVSLFSF